VRRPPSAPGARATGPSCTEGAATFDVLVTGLDPGGPDYQVQPVDPLGGTDLGDGTLRTPLLGFEESARRYARS
jgi:hypothetical protein